MTNTEIGILILLMAVFWLAMSALAIANIYCLRSENKRRKKKSQKTMIDRLFQDELKNDKL